MEPTHCNHVLDLLLTLSLFMIISISPGMSDHEATTYKLVIGNKCSIMVKRKVYLYHKAEIKTRSLSFPNTLLSSSPYQ